MSTPSFKITRNPTFLLKGVDPVAVWSAYQNGKYTNYKPIPDPSLNINSIQLTLPEGTSPADEIYTIRDKNGTQTLAMSTNHSLTINGGKLNELPVDGYCDWCRKRLTEPPVGKPVRVDYDHVNNILIIYTDGADHSFECAYAGIIRDQDTSIRSSDPIYTNSENILLTWFNLLYPGEKLNPAPDYRLLQPRGPMSQDVFEQNMHCFKRTTNIYITPIKVQYIQLKTQ